MSTRFLESGFSGTEYRGAAENKGKIHGFDTFS